MKNCKRKHIRNKWVTTALIMLLPLFVSATDIYGLYMAMPETMNPVLVKKQRFELFEYAKADLGDSVANRFNQMSYLTHYDSINNHIQIKNASNATFEMFLINHKTDTVIGVIRTVCSPICQSQIKFYDIKWKEYLLRFDMPKATDWIKEDIINPQINLTNILSVSFISLTYNAEKKQIEATNNSLDYLDKEDKEKVEKYVNEDVFRYKFEDGKWVKVH